MRKYVEAQGRGTPSPWVHPRAPLGSSQGLGVPCPWACDFHQNRRNRRDRRRWVGPVDLGGAMIGNNHQGKAEEKNRRADRHPLTGIGRATSRNILSMSAGSDQRIIPANTTSASKKPKSVKSIIVCSVQV